MEPRGGDLVCRSFPDSFNLFNCFVLDAAFQCAAYILSIMLFFSFPLPLKSRLCPKPLVSYVLKKAHTVVVSMSDFILQELFPIPWESVGGGCGQKTQGRGAD